MERIDSLGERYPARVSTRRDPAVLTIEQLKYDRSLLHNELPYHIKSF